MKKKGMAEDHFIALDVKKLEQIENERKKLLRSAMQLMPEMHFMRCPRCSRQLSEKSTTGIIVHTCNQCGGIWIDASNLKAVLAMGREGAESFLQTKTE